MISQFRCSVHVDQDVIMVSLNKDCERKNRLLCAECMEDKELKTLCAIIKLESRTQEYRARRQKELEQQSLLEQQKLEQTIKMFVTLKERSNQVLDSLVSECQSFQLWLKQQLLEQLTYYESLTNNLTKTKLGELAELLSGNQEKVPCFTSLPKKYNSLGSLIQSYSEQIGKEFKNILTIIEKENKVSSNQDSKKYFKQLSEQNIDSDSAIIAHNQKKSLFFVGQNNLIQIYEQDGIKLKKSIGIVGHQGEVTAIAIYRSGDVLVSGSRDKSMKLWQKTNNNWDCLQTLFDHDGVINEIQLTPKEDQVLSASSDKTIKVWLKLSNSLQLVQTITESSDTQYNFAISDKYLAASTTWAWKCYIDFFKLTQGKWKKVETNRTEDRIKTLYFSNDQELICQQFDPAKVQVYIINSKDNLELKQEIALKQFQQQFQYQQFQQQQNRSFDFSIISLGHRFFLKNCRTLVVLVKNETNYVIEQIIDQSFDCGCVDVLGGYLFLINSVKKKIEIYGMKD